MKYQITIICSKCLKDIKTIIEEHYSDRPKQFTPDDLKPIYCKDCSRLLEKDLIN